MPEHIINCPRCQTPMAKEKVREKGIIILDRCENCGGTWFDRGELQALDHIVEPVIFEIRRIPRKEGQLEALHCPSCEDHPLMQKHEHHRDEKVVIDFCPQCEGFWLDKGELKAIQQESWFSVITKLMS